MTVTSSPHEQRSASPQLAASRLDQIAREIGYRRVDSGLYTGPCPTCGGHVLLWSHRARRPSYSYSCLGCGHEGAMYGLWHRVRSASQVAA